MIQPETITPRKDSLKREPTYEKGRGRRIYTY